LPQGEDVATRNVEVQRADPASLLSLYRRLIAVRRAHPALVIGSYRRIKAERGLLTFLRSQDDESLLVALNLGGEPATAILPDDERGTVLVSSSTGREGQVVDARIELAGHEGVVVKLF
jgi:alpha-glucosidase